MSLYNLFPVINGKKSAISGYGLLLLGIGGLLSALGNCLQSLELAQCYAEVHASYEPLLAAFMGLGVIGISHKQVKAEEQIESVQSDTTSIKATGESTETTVIDMTAKNI